MRTIGWCPGGATKTPQATPTEKVEVEKEVKEEKKTTVKKTAMK